MSTIDHLERLEQEIASIAQPLVDHYEQVNKEIADLQKQIVQLRKARSQLRVVLRGINPELVPVAARANGKRSKKSGGASPERLAAMTIWLQERKDEINASGGVYASGLASRNDFDIISHQSGISKAFLVLHDRGVLRLDHEGQGGAKFYKVV